MAIICPTITVETPAEFARQLAKVDFAERIHIDVSDGQFSPRKLLSLAQVYLPEQKICDIHVMNKVPVDDLMTLISLRPDLVILHAEAEGNITKAMAQLQAVGIRAGIALLPQTSVTAASTLLKNADHVLVFGGHLGYQGGQADLSQLVKVQEIKAAFSHIEISWDGGVTVENAPQLVAAGVDVLNVGAAIHAAKNPAAVFAKLSAAAA